MKNTILALFLNGLIFFVSCSQTTGDFPSAGDSPRLRINFDSDWKFHLGHAIDASKDFNYGTARLFAKTAENYGTCIRPDFEDKDWEDVDLPHDWVVKLPFVNFSEGEVKSHGYKPTGCYFPQNSIGWYRRTFDIPFSYNENNRVEMFFDGVFRDCEVWVNNFYLGRHFSGYTSFSYDITDFLYYDKRNVVTLRVDAGKVEGWFYEGAGIYRHVWLNVFDNLHFPENGIFIYSALSEDYKKASVHVDCRIENNRVNTVNGTVRNYVVNQKGEKITQGKLQSFTLDAGSSMLLKEDILIDNPKLWNLDDPHLYKVIAVIRSGNKIIDKIETKFGIRSIVADKDKGLFLNGKPVKVQGVCCHQDHAGVGSALPDYLHYYRIGLLKEMGVNAYRSSHNPPAPELLEACDSLGMLVLDEIRLLNSGKEYMRQMEDLAFRDRNHPSVFMWCIGNEEEVFQGTEEGKRISASMMRKLKQIDPTRLVTYAANIGNVTSGVNEIIPVRGFNYNLGGIDDYRGTRPDQPVFGTEMGSTVTTRGIYIQDSVKCYLTDFDENYPPWASTAEQWWTLAAQREWYMGGFVWTGFDYRGEPTPYHWPNINSHFGVMDMCGFPKNIYYYYQSWWTDEDVLHIAPHWNWQGKEGKTITVWVNSNAQEVELFLNEKSLGKKEMPRNGHLNWDVKYEQGKLKAVAYKERKTFEKTVETTGEPYEIILTPSRTAMRANSKDVTVINVSVKDKEGRMVPTAGQLIRFSLSGDNARIIGVGNGDPSCHEADQCAPEKYERSLFNGYCQLILQSRKVSGKVVISASSTNLKPAEVEIKMLPE